jgi:NADH-quinone oxidoreductase subunit E
MDFVITEEELNQILSCYPRKEAALLPVLRRIQKKAGYISPEAERYAAELLGVHPNRVHEVVTFYSRLREKPAGKYLILVCESVCCSLLGSEEILNHLKNRLKIETGETTPDKLFTLETIECLAQCERSPAMMINDEVFAPVTLDEIDRILSEKS